MTPAQRRLAERLGHDFTDSRLFARALTHRSAGADHNERLEYLGDAILGFLVAEHLLNACPDAPEGKLTRLRARIVRRESLAATARVLGVGDALRLGPGEQKNGGRERDSILADAFEAIVGALYVDSDLATCRDRVLAPWEAGSRRRRSTTGARTRRRACRSSCKRSAGRCRTIGSWRSKAPLTAGRSPCAAASRGPRT